MIIPYAALQTHYKKGIKWNKIKIFLKFLKNFQNSFKNPVFCNAFVTHPVLEWIHKKGPTQNARIKAQKLKF